MGPIPKTPVPRYALTDLALQVTVICVAGSLIDHFVLVTQRFSGVKRRLPQVLYQSMSPPLTPGPTTF
jgi:hypothetical protein